MKMRIAQLLAALTLTVGIGGVAAATPAQADRIVESGGNECGASYNLVGYWNMYKPGTTLVRGHYEVYWNGTRNCGIARCYNNCGQLLYRWAAIAVASHSGWDDVDSGMFRYYAGPVYSDPSAGVCIDIRAFFGTQVDDASVADFWKTNVHCD